MMNIIIIIITFLFVLADKMSEKPINERASFLKRLKLGSISLLLLVILLALQLCENNKSSKKELIEEFKSNETYEHTITTKEKVDEANKLIDSVLFSLKQEIEFTREEFSLISLLNTEIAETKNSALKSLTEYQKLNSMYSKQLNIEKEKVINSRPDVKVMFPKSTSDSLNASYQFQLINYGQRVADSVIFFSIMALMDSTNTKITMVTDLKTNEISANVLRLPQNQDVRYFSNSIVVPKKDINNYGIGILLVKYKYFDYMTNLTIKHPINAYLSTSIEDINNQYGHNVEQSLMKEVEHYLFNTRLDLYNIFFRD
jgi:hypothetical protein